MAVMKKINRNLVDDKTGLISRRIFFDLEIYAQELKDVFARTWLFLGHESMIPESGDYVTNYMGEDPVIVWRDKNRKISSFSKLMPASWDEIVQNRCRECRSIHVSISRLDVCK